MTLHHHPQEYVGYLHQSQARVQLLLAGHRYQAKWREPMIVARPYLLLTFIDSGRGMVEDHQPHELKTGHWYAVFPDEVVRVHSDRDDPMCYFWMGLDGEDVLPIMRQAALSPQHRVSQTANLRQTRKHFQALTNYLKTDTPASTHCAYGMMWLLLAQLSAQQHTQTTPDTHTHEHHAVTQACQIMQHQYVAGINASDVAQIIGMDRSYLSSLFSKTMGMTMRDYLSELRINRAQQFLRHSTLTVEQIAQAVGYSEYRSFIRIFQQRTGLTPRAFAQRARGK